MFIDARRTACLVTVLAALALMPLVGCGGGSAPSGEPEPAIEREVTAEDPGTAPADSGETRATQKSPFLYSYDAPRSGSKFNKGQRFTVSGYIRNSGKPAVGLPILLVLRDFSSQNELLPAIVCTTDDQGRFTGVVPVDFGKNTKGKKFTLTPEFRGSAAWRANVWTGVRRTYTVNN